MEVSTNRSQTRPLKIRVRKFQKNMKTQRIRSMIGKVLAVTAMALTFLCSDQRLQQLGAQTNVPRCEPVNAQLDGSVFPCGDSPIGFCAVGTIPGGLLKGSKQAVYTGASLSAGMPNAEPATTFSYSGTQVFQTEQGDLQMSVVGVQDNTRHVFTELARITGGTGRFTTATGNLFISGTLTPDGIGFESKVTGEICYERTK
jgi:hypothetical protein